MRTSLLATVPLALAAALPAQLVTLSPVADATTDASQPSVNFGSAPELDFGKAFNSTGPTFQVWMTRGHVQFDLTSLIGTGLVPTRATFFWYQRTSNAAGCLDVSLHNVVAPWSEGTITWQNQPAHDPTEISRTCVGDSFALGWKEFDVTSLAQQWLAGTVPNLGFVIRDPSESTAGAARPGFGHSREFATASLQPYLELDFAFSFGTGCSTHATIPTLGVSGGAAIMTRQLDLTTDHLTTGSLTAVFFGLSNTSWSGTPLPFDLTAAGFPGCWVNSEPTVGVAIGIATSPTATLTVTVPNAPAFDGQPLYAQTFALTPSTALEASNGLGFRVWQ